MKKIEKLKTASIENKLKQIKGGANRSIVEDEVVFIVTEDEIVF